MCVPLQGKSSLPSTMSNIYRGAEADFQEEWGWDILQASWLATTQGYQKDLN